MLKARLYRALTFTYVDVGKTTNANARYPICDHSTRNEQT